MMPTRRSGERGLGYSPLIPSQVQRTQLSSVVATNPSLSQTILNGLRIIRGTESNKHIFQAMLIGPYHYIPLGYIGTIEHELMRLFNILKVRANNSDLIAQYSAQAAFFVYLLQGQEYQLSCTHIAKLFGEKNIAYLEQASLSGYGPAVDLYKILSFESKIDAKAASTFDVLETLQAFYRLKKDVESNPMISQLMQPLSRKYSLPFPEPTDLEEYITNHIIFSKLNSLPRPER